MLWNYLKIAFKVLLRRKFFAFASLFAITFTLAILLVVAAILDQAFGPLPPETRLDRTLGIYSARIEGEYGARTGPAGYKLLDTYARDLPGVERLAIASSPTLTAIYHDGRRVDLYTKLVDTSYWSILDFEFLEGRPPTADEERGGNRVAVVNAATRDRLFDGAPAVGKSLALDGEQFTIIGVVADVPFFRFVPFSDIWMPLSPEALSSHRDELVGQFMGILLARDAADFDSIKSEFAARIASADLSNEKGFDRVLAAPSTLFEFVSSQLFNDRPDSGNSGKLLALIVAFALLFMLLPAINLVNINVSRIMERSSEIGIRKAFGASTATLVAQFVVENVAITLAGGLVAVALALALMRLVDASGVFPYSDLGLNARVFGYGLGAALVFGIVSGVVPAWKMARLDPVLALKGGAK